jgi:peptidoglycan-associated lipoprotein
MKFRRQGLTITSVLAATAALLGGCATSTLPETPAAPAVETRAVAAKPATPATPAAATGTPGSQISTVDLGRQGAGSSVAGASRGATVAMAALPSQRIVYFDFDSFVIKDDFKPLLDAYAKVLQTSRAKKLVIEGHTDERGGREYNLALGQKRAAAVVRSLTLLGATETQLEAVSFGEERPAAQGSDESAWAKNRRAEMKDR